MNPETYVLWEEQRAGADKEEKRGAEEENQGGVMGTRREERQNQVLFLVTDHLRAARKKIYALLGTEVDIKKGRGEQVLWTVMEESKPEGIEQQE